MLWCRTVDSAWPGAAAVDGISCNGDVVGVGGLPLTAAQTVAVSVLFVPVIIIVFGIIIVEIYTGFQCQPLIHVLEF